MGMGIYPQLERDIANIDPLEICGRALLKAIYDPRHKKADDSVIQLERFIGYDSDEVAMYVDDLGGDSEELPIPEPTWFEAIEGVTILEHILETSQMNDDARQDTEHLLHILNVAKEQHIRFYLTTDMP